MSKFLFAYRAPMDYQPGSPDTLGEWNGQDGIYWFFKPSRRPSELDHEHTLGPLLGRLAGYRSGRPARQQTRLP